MLIVASERLWTYISALWLLSPLRLSCLARQMLGEAGAVLINLQMRWRIERNTSFTEDILNRTLLGTGITYRSYSD
jgi:hypothetical protein